MKRIVVLGSTGSIGTQTLDVVRDHPDHYTVAALVAHTNEALLREQAAEFQPDAVALTGRDNLEVDGFHSFAGESGLRTLLEQVDHDLLVNAITGSAGLAANVQALDNGVDLAIANKESLVMAGPLLLAQAERTGARIIPVDSEHSALFQCLRAGRLDEIRKLHLTASGGPFRGQTRDQLETVTAEQALSHPTWKMGPKISIDSATLANKALELIEAHVLFGVEPDDIEVLIHPQSIVHSMVEFQDGSFVAHLGVPDMRIPIQYALSHPERLPRQAPLSLAEVRTLHFEAPDHQTFPTLRLAYEACRSGGTAPVVFNAANEMAVAAFLEGRIAFLSIFEALERALEDHDSEPITSIEQVMEVDHRTRRQIASWK